MTHSAKILPFGSAGISTPEDLQTMAQIAAAMPPVHPATGVDAGLLERASSLRKVLVDRFGLADDPQSRMAVQALLLDALSKETSSR